MSKDIHYTLTIKTDKGAATATHDSDHFINIAELSPKLEAAHSIVKNTEDNYDYWQAFQSILGEK